MEILAHAKINLFLDIQGKREDGYHDIISVMQTVDWCDRVVIKENGTKKIRLSCSDHQIPTDMRNTAHQAACLFFEKIKLEYGVDIMIEKNIPHAAGLAGGSADAAAVLRGLNQMFDLPLSERELLVLGKKVGADVPFCILGGTKLSTGIGDCLDSFPLMPFCYVVCAKLGEGMSTPRAYSDLDKKYNNFTNYLPHEKSLELIRRAFEVSSLRELRDGAYNIFESIVSTNRPCVEIIKKGLLEEGALVSMMSGSGPSVFGVFEHRDRAESACERLRWLGACCKVCVPTQSLI